MYKPTRTITESGCITYSISKKVNYLHRENGPAIIWPDGSMGYYTNNKMHREDGPVVIWGDGNRNFYINGEYVIRM